MDVDALVIILGGFREGSDEMEVFTAWFYNWRKVFETSVQPNIDFCGLY